MAVELIPSILATTKSQLTTRAVLAQRLSKTVHLDLMDGTFVPTSSVSPSVVPKVNWTSQVEIHAMISNPAVLLSLLLLIKPRRVYLHVELGESLLPIVAVLRSRKIELGLAINPQTPISVLAPFIRLSKSILVMSVKPGKYHAPLWPGVFTRIREVHRRWPKKTIACDGGMNQQTIKRAISAGVQRVITGSDVMLNVDPQAEWNKLKALTKAR